jgi:heme/copper-type cytochrome/quinol oxidase subunit 2
MSIALWIIAGAVAWVVIFGFFLCLVAAGARGDEQMDASIEQWEREHRV